MDESDKKKQIILDSATGVLSEKGFADATISEIARGAGLTPSGIYTYFKGKEEILFAIIEAFVASGHDGLVEHLQGIQGADNKLRKAIWFHCKAYSGSRNEIKIVLEVRSYPRFYQSSAYTALKSYSGLFMEIIQEGMDDGTFPGVPSPMILRDVILGTIDHIAINWTVKNAPNTLDKAERIYEMIMDSVRSSGKETRPVDRKDHKRKRMIDSATALFAEKGFNDTSMLEIAGQADVAEGTVYEYFSTKENLLVSIPAEKLAELYDSIQRNEPEKEIREIIARIFRFYNEDKDYAAVLVLLLRTNRRFHQSEGSEMIENIFHVIRELIVRGQNEGAFKKDLDMEICRDMLFGSIDHILIPRIIFDRNYDLPKIGGEISELFLNMIKA